MLILELFWTVWRTPNIFNLIDIFDVITVFVSLFLQGHSEGKQEVTADISCRIPVPWSLLSNCCWGMVPLCHTFAQLSHFIYQWGLILLMTFREPRVLLNHLLHSVREYSFLWSDARSWDCGWWMDGIVKTIVELSTWLDQGSSWQKCQ